MTHYFSRLARTTGLRFGSGAGVAAHDAGAAQPASASAPLAPHVEELAFVEPSPGAQAVDARSPFDSEQPRRPEESELLRRLSRADDRSPPARTREEGAAGGQVQAPNGARAEPTRKASRVLTPPARPFQRTGIELVSQESASRGQESRALTPPAETSTPPRAQSPSGTENVNRARPAPDSSRVETPDDSPARLDAFTRTLETLGVFEDEARQDLPHRPDAETPDGPTQAAVRRAYLREVVEWIAAPPEAARDDAVGGPLAGDAGAGDERPRERAGQPPAARAAASGELEVQDFSLSIGSISVVIEEPPKQAPEPARAQVAAAERGRPSSAAVETSRLRRHYIRGL